MKKIVANLTSVLILIVPFQSHGWNYTGHVVIAQIAYDQLNSIKKEKADDLANLIIAQLPENQKEKLNKSFNNASSFAKVAALPDVWRKWNLSTLFLKFHALPPLNLMFSLKQPTAGWHFIDTPYPESSLCKTIEANNVVWAIDAISKNIANAKLPTTKALDLVLLSHYIGDIHQPLHVMTNVSQSCIGDRGGNDFCLKENINSKCVKNLHSLWDSAVGYLKPHENIRSLAFNLESEFPKERFGNTFQNLEAKTWSIESYTYGSTIYNLQPLEKPSPTYFQNGQAVSKSQIALAGYRLGQVLQNIL